MDAVQSYRIRRTALSMTSKTGQIQRGTIHILPSKGKRNLQGINEYHQRPVKHTQERMVSTRKTHPLNGHLLLFSSSKRDRIPKIGKSSPRGKQRSPFPSPGGKVPTIEASKPRQSKKHIRPKGGSQPPPKTNTTAYNHLNTQP